MKEMSWEEAVKWCEDHECTECDIYLKKLDKRTEEERHSYVPCCRNLVSKKDWFIKGGK